MKPKRGIARKKEKWVKVFQVSKNNNKHLYKQNYQFFLPPSTPRLPEGARTPVARNQLPEFGCSQRSEGSCILGSLPKRFYDTDSRSLIIMCGKNEMGKEDKKR